ncbi:MAG: hypothetical protein CL699_04930 [Chloroflexi bacterium]|nr:hypothetical protein [Chloroflexota bacterium]
MSQTNIFVFINIFGGIAVLGSYIVCLMMFPEQREPLWGGVVGTTRNVVVTFMLLAAAGYLTFLYISIFNVSADVFSSKSPLNGNLILILTISFLISSTIWMPASVAFLETSNSLFWYLSVASLWIAALSLVGLLISVTTTDFSTTSNIPKILSVGGLAIITFHCLVFDAIMWVSRFPN